MGQLSVDGISGAITGHSGVSAVPYTFGGQGSTHGVG